MKPLWLAPLLVCLAGLPGCGDGGECGPGDAPASGVTATIAADTVTYGAFTSSANNDCTPPGASVTSISIHGEQQQPAPTGAFTPQLALCISRPDDIGGDPIALGFDSDDLVQIISVNAEAGGCTFAAADRSTPPEATITFSGFCGDDAAGYAIELTGSVALTRTCGAAVDTVTAELGGRVAVEAL